MSHSERARARMVAALARTNITVIGKEPEVKTAAKSYHRTPGENFAFAFDIDGVIYKSGELCAGAQEAIKYLDTNNFPFIFLTNEIGR